MTTSVKLAARPGTPCAYILHRLKLSEKISVYPVLLCLYCIRVDTKPLFLICLIAILKCKEKKKKKVVVAEALSDLVVYTRSVKFFSFRQSRDNQHNYENTSFEETKARKLLKSSGEMFMDSKVERRKSEVNKFSWLHHQVDDLRSLIIPIKMPFSQLQGAEKLFLS